MMRGVMGQHIVARLNWGAFDHASHAPQLRSCNYYLSDSDCGAFDCASYAPQSLSDNQIMCITHYKIVLIVIAYIIVVISFLLERPFSAEAFLMKT